MDECDSAEEETDLHDVVVVVEEEVVDRTWNCYSTINELILVVIIVVLLFLGGRRVCGNPWQIELGV